MIVIEMPTDFTLGNNSMSYDSRKEDYGLYNIDIDLSSNLNTYFISCKDLYYHVVKNCSIEPCKLFGLCFSPYTKQDPVKGEKLTEEHVRECLTIVSPYTEWIRTYSCMAVAESGINNSIGHELGFKVAGGIWLDNNLTNNEKEISCGIDVAQAGDVDMLLVGNEVLLRNELTENQLIEYINRVKIACPEIPVTYPDVYDVLLKHPNVISAVDFVFPNYYPYDYGTRVEYAIYLLHLWHQEILDAAEGKPVIISETGWPSDGDNVGRAFPSLENASFYFQNFVSWAKAENVSFFYFEAFDEPWKALYGSPQAGHLGIWDKDLNLKPGMERVFNCETIPNNWEIGVINGPGDPVIEFTYVPRIGSLFDELEGRVSHVEPGDYRVVVYTRFGDEWWSKPQYDDPRNVIWPDGNWSCMITPGRAGALATEIVAYIIPYNYHPPIMSGESSLPLELDENSLAKVSIIRPKTIHYIYIPVFLQNLLQRFPILGKILNQIITIK
jgi:exo-beta-1,3-glucanase (GH17 family)